MWVVFPLCHAHAGTNHIHLKFQLKIAYMNIELWKPYILVLLHSYINFSLIVENRSNINILGLILLDKLESYAAFLIIHA